MPCYKITVAPSVVEVYHMLHTFAVCLYVQHSQIWLQSNVALKSYGPLSAPGHTFKLLVINYRQMVSDTQKQTHMFHSG